MMPSRRSFWLSSARSRQNCWPSSSFLVDFGPQLGRPYADTLKGSKHSNMKEMRFSAVDSEWRAAFAFDPQRNAILLIAGDKCGSQKRFYKQLIAKADIRFPTIWKT
ncbi:type II toxin-antitoxin system RelE/ParE family toxin [Rhizobium leguminosarum]|uniref:type II toxin-antitoxin system RelE/ParE family toxin n=1 Tax=Rhizobium leguminosarum TaxID=384 RepID=UPI0028AF469C|nr:type II toxin-antitoxin system RelE/ParE family toxin [Rhizobium leguminosarum]